MVGTYKEIKKENIMFKWVNKTYSINFDKSCNFILNLIKLNFLEVIFGGIYKY